MEYNAQQAPHPETISQSPVNNQTNYSQNDGVEQHKKDARTAMILGIIGAVLCWYPVGSIAGIVLGALAFSRSRKNKELARQLGVKENGMNVAGFACGLVGIIAGAIITLVYLFFAVVVVFAVFAAIKGTAMGVTSSLPEIIDSLDPIISSAIGLL